MEDMEEAIGISTGTPKHLTNNIVKGKRTKRQRPQSPIPYSLPTPSISTEDNNVEEEDDDDLDFYNPSSSEFDEEEEDMANCLILLAQGHRPRVEDNKQYVSKRYTSKRFVESDGNKEGAYVYQCKTCDRAFPSFQALGGHRASHKKPKGLGVVVEEKKIRRQLSFLSSDYEEEETVGGGGERKAKSHATSRNNSFVQLQLLGGSYSKASPKVHECGICGAEFGSGQALGGHMRRHRVTVGTTASVPTTTTTTTTTSLTLVSGFGIDKDNKEMSEMKKSKSLLSLDLDLNLPAPADEEKQQQIQKQQQQQQQQSQNQSGIVLSTGTLVDCHY